MRAQSISAVSTSVVSISAVSISALSICAALIGLVGTAQAQRGTWGAKPPPGGRLEVVVNGKETALPTLKTDVTAHIHGDLASVSLLQTFANPAPAQNKSEPGAQGASGPGALHARYLFPLPPNAAVHAMRITVGDRVIEAEIQQVQEARATYEAAKAKGQQAALLTQHRPDVFTQEVANLMPGQPVTVELEYVHPVPRREGEYRFHFPLVVGPRYLTDASPKADEPPKLKIGAWLFSSSPPVATGERQDTRRASIEVWLDAGVPLAFADSPSHAVKISAPGRSLRHITLARGRVPDDQDFELRYALATEQITPAVTAHREGQEGVFSLMVEPPKSAHQGQITPREITFVLDCSGSMSGVPLDASKRLVRQMLGGLRPTDHFRIIRFSASAQEMNGGALKATPANITAGKTWLDALTGGGGTEMTAGIRAALDPPVTPGAIRLVVFLTDGYIGHDIDVIRLIRQRIGDARLFSFGVGFGVNRSLMERMGVEGRGLARIVRPDEDVELAADQMADRLNAPFLTDVQVDWGQAPISEVWPPQNQIPDLFLGGSLRLVGHYNAAGQWPVTIKGRLAGKPVELPFTLTLPEQATARALPITHARAEVAALMREYQWPETSEPERKALEQTITDLGLAHRLVTQWTAFVAVDKRVVNPTGQAREAEVPVSQVRGVGKGAYSKGSFGGSAAPEPAFWAALALMLGLLGWQWRRGGLRG